MAAAAGQGQDMAVDGAAGDREDGGAPAAAAVAAAQATAAAAEMMEVDSAPSLPAMGIE